MNEIVLNEAINKPPIPSLIDELNKLIRKYNDTKEAYESKISTESDILNRTLLVEHMRDLKDITDRIENISSRLQVRIRSNDYGIMDDLRKISDEIANDNLVYEKLVKGEK